MGITTGKGKTMNIEFAKSMSGHDRNQYYLIIKKDDEFVYLVNGTTKPLTKPKKKNRKRKSVSLKLLAERNIVTYNCSAFFIDVEGEYTKLVQKLGGKTIKIRQR